MVSSDKLQVKKKNKKIKGSRWLESFHVGWNVNQAQEITGTVLISITTAGGTTYKETLPGY